MDVLTDGAATALAGLGPGDQTTLVLKLAVPPAEVSGGGNGASPASEGMRAVSGTGRAASIERARDDAEALLDSLEVDTVLWIPTAAAFVVTAEASAFERLADSGLFKRIVQNASMA